MQKKVINLGNDNKVKVLLKRFREEKRTKRREKLLLMFGQLHDEFDELIPAIKADISNILNLADIFHKIDRATGIIKRYKQLSFEARYLDLEPPPLPELPEDIIEAYVLIVGRRPRPASKLKRAN
jgi:hypothetical protein